uniref:pectate lyase-like adhesive domain-containing protein n=1 Tax=Secundilactobacillus kimchicus TaxID=528209 RepID=UPI0024A8CA44
MYKRQNFPICEKKERFKMYKSGKHWIVRGTTSLILLSGVLAYQGMVANPQKVYADQNQRRMDTINSLKRSNSAILESNLFTKDSVQDPTIFNTATVSNEKELTTALKNKNINFIDVTANIGISQYENNGLFGTVTIPARDLTLNLNQHIIDFAGISYWMDPDDFVDTTISINNGQVYGSSYWGPISVTGGVAMGHQHVQIYQDINYVGSQLLSSIYTSVIIKGDVDAKLVPRYNSPIFHHDINTQNTSGSEDNDQEIFELTNLTVDDGAHFTGETDNGSPVIMNNSGSFTVGENATVELSRKSSQHTAENGNYILRVNGNYVQKKGSKVILTGSSQNNEKVLDVTGGTAQISNDAVLNVTGGANAGCLLYLENNGNLYASNGASVNISQNTPMSGSNLINLSGNSNLYVGDGANFNVISSNSSKDVNLVNLTGIGKIRFDKNSNIKLQADGTGTVNLINSVTSNINIDNPSEVVFDLSKNTNKDSRIIGINEGSLGLSHFKYSLDGKNYSKPFKNGKLAITGRQGNVTNSSAQGMTKDSENKFITDLAKPFASLKYLKIASSKLQKLTVDKLTNNPIVSNSHVITGTGTPGAYIKVTGDTNIPAGTLTADPYDTTKYNVQVGTDGRWSVSLPQDQYLTEGETITVDSSYEFMTQTISTKVSDDTGNIKTDAKAAIKAEADKVKADIDQDASLIEAEKKAQKNAVDEAAEKATTQ